MHTVQLPPNRFVMNYMGETAITVPFGDGLRCVGGRIYRYAVLNSGSGGAITLGPGVVSIACGSFGAGGCIQPGSTWFFQSYYRDGNGPCGSGFNLSSAIRVGFQP